MNFTRRALLALTAASFVASTAFAQAWPAKPIRVIVPFPAGGGTDVLTREVTGKMPGYNFVVENRPGAGGNLGVDAAAKSTADGYTLVMGQTSNLAINPTLYSHLPYDPVKDLTPIGLVASSPLLIVTSANSPFHTIEDVIKEAKAHPGSINFASSGNGTVAHLTMVELQKQAGIKLTHIPYKGASQGTTDVMSGAVQLYVSSVPTLIGHIRSGKMRALAVTSAKRVADLPQVRTVAESGYKGFESVTWFGILGPANLSKDIVSKLNADINKALKDAELKKQFDAQGADILGGTPEQFARLIRDDVARWGAVVKESGAKID
ncbi:MAG TPA: tripartite tricarboxylate transporter substrate binding protein [Ramlibacter sp.]|uniref:Bug family tripartite tricarboxylate transporter substrate binding protein n=1 Tax=Ramlibacter sp. TaxID=1917967 RepID=UPI002BA769B5|nr:tripartite tricarboxylate transporter substrate binding protein [Ramlibacter sp.]HVZ46595.1 tripartite tricarboxylate transporter substrate binding protein [Ramlibacter sp.]